MHYLKPLAPRLVGDGLSLILSASAVWPDACHFSCAGFSAISLHQRAPRLWAAPSAQNCAPHAPNAASAHGRCLSDDWRVLHMLQHAIGTRYMPVVAEAYHSGRAGSGVPASSSCQSLIKQTVDHATKPYGLQCEVPLQDTLPHLLCQGHMCKAC